MLLLTWFYYLIVFAYGSITKSSPFFEVVPKQSIQTDPDPHLANPKRIKQSNNPTSTRTTVENDRLQNRK